MIVFRYIFGISILKSKLKRHEIYVILVIANALPIQKKRKTFHVLINRFPKYF